MKDYAKSPYYETVVDILADVLQLEKEEIEPDSKLLEELGAESVDFLDIINRIEEKTSISLPDVNILKYLSDKYGKELFFEDGKLNNTGTKVIQMAMPEVDASRFHTGLREHEIADFITPLTFVRQIEVYKTLEEWKPEKCNKCGSGNLSKEDKDASEYLEISIDPGPLYKCRECGNLISHKRIEEEIYEKVMAEK
ncbi:MAG: acyl carrier protein [Spirochaetales bacterium]|nr:acyl carrier protein [Spirochaetales bacterium]